MTDGRKNQRAETTLKDQNLLDVVKEVLSQDPHVLFAYLYGSFAEFQEGNDIDLAVYALETTELHALSVDLKIALHKKTGLPPEKFDVRIINGLEKEGNVFTLLYLKKVLEPNRLLSDKNPVARADFLERYGSKYRECEVFIREVVA
jgi:uncharacterized protein